MKHTGLLRLTETIPLDTEYSFLSASNIQTTPVTRSRKPGANPRAFLRVHCIFQPNLWFPGKSVSSRFDFLHVIYGNVQAAEVLTGRSSS